MQRDAAKHRLLSRREVEEFYGIPKRYLERVVKKSGPRYVKVGRLIRYRVADIEDWIDGNVVEEGQ